MLPEQYDRLEVVLSPTGGGGVAVELPDVGITERSERIITELVGGRDRLFAPTAPAGDDPLSMVDPTPQYLTWSEDVVDHQYALGELMLPGRAREEVRRRMVDGRGVRLCLRFASQQLESLAWEYARLDLDGYPLTLDGTVSIVRRPSRPARPRTPGTGTGRALVAVAANPGGPWPALPGASAEAAQVEAHLRAWGYSVELLAVTGRDDLDRATAAPLDIFVFLGHGGFPGLPLGGDDCDEPCLVIPGADGVDHIGAADLVRMVGSAELVALACCYSGHEDAAVHGLRHALAAEGVPAVVGMNGPIEAGQAARFLGSFFQRLAAGQTIDQAMCASRHDLVRLALMPLWGHPCISLGAEPNLLVRDTPQRVATIAADLRMVAGGAGSVIRQTVAGSYIENQIIHYHPTEPGEAGPVRFGTAPIPAQMVHRALVDEVHELFHDDRRAICTIALIGDTGQGKSTLAARYVDRYVNDYDLTAWIECESRTSARQQVERLITTLRQRGTPIVGETLDEQLVAFGEHLESRTGWLLVFDNVVDREDLEGLLPQARTGHVIITSQFAEWTDVAHVIGLERFTENEAQELLQQAADEEDPEAALALAELVDFLPLDVGFIAQDLAAARGRISLSSMLGTLRASPAAGLRFAQHRRDAFVDTRLRRAEARVPGATDAAVMASVLGGDRLPSVVLDDLAHTDAFHELTAHSLGRWDPGPAFWMHRAVREAVRRVRPEPFEAGAALLAAATALSKHFPTDLDDSESIATRTQLMAAAISVLSGAETMGLRSTALGALATGVGLLLLESRDATSAVRFHDWADALLPEDEPANSVVRADILNNRGRCQADVADRYPWGTAEHEAQRRLALDLYTAALELDRSRNDPDDARPYYRMNNVVLGQTGPGAEDTVREVVAGLERIHGPRFPSLAIPLDVLASKLRSRALETDDEAVRAALLEEAETVARRADDVAQSDRPDGMTRRRMAPLLTLAWLLTDTGTPQDALPLLAERIRIAQFLVDHAEPSALAEQVQNLAKARRSRGNMISGWWSQFSPEHLALGIDDLEVAVTTLRPSTTRERTERLADMVSLARLYRRVGRYEDAAERIRMAREAAADGEIPTEGRESLDREAIYLAVVTDAPDARQLGETYRDDHPGAQPWQRGDVEAWLGLLAMRSGEYRQALEWFRTALQTSPRHGREGWRMESALHAHDLDTAKEILASLLDDGGSPGAVAGVAQAMASAGTALIPLAEDLLQFLVDHDDLGEMAQALLPITAILNERCGHLELAVAQAWSATQDPDSLSRILALQMVATVIREMADVAPQAALPWYERLIDDSSFERWSLNSRYELLSDCRTLAEKLGRGELWQRTSARRQEVMDRIAESEEIGVLKRTMDHQIAAGAVPAARQTLDYLIEIHRSRDEWDKVGISLQAFARSLGRTDPRSAAVSLEVLPDGFREGSPEWYARVLAERASQRAPDDAEALLDLAEARLVATEVGARFAIALVDVYQARRLVETDPEQADRLLLSAIAHADGPDACALRGELHAERGAQLEARDDSEGAIAERALAVEAFLEAKAPDRAAQVNLAAAYPRERGDAVALRALALALQSSRLAAEPARSALVCEIYNHWAWRISPAIPVRAIELYEKAAQAGLEAGSPHQELLAIGNALTVAHRHGDVVPRDKLLSILEDWCARFPRGAARDMPHYLTNLAPSAEAFGRLPSLMAAVERALGRVEDRMDPDLYVEALHQAIALAVRGGWSAQEAAWRSRLAVEERQRSARLADDVDTVLG